MKKPIVISKSNLPTTLPLHSTVFYSFLLYYFKVDGIYWGVFITLCCILWIVSFYRWYLQEEIKLDDDVKIKSDKSNFAQKLEELAREKVRKTDESRTQ